MPVRLLLSIVAAALLFAQAQPTADSRTLLNSGVQAFKAAQYAEATDLFERAVAADPEFLTARLYLATALMSQFVPGVTTPANAAFADRAEREFENVVARDPQNVVALQSLASLAYNRAQGITDTAERRAMLEAAERRYERVVDVQPANKEALYSLGVIAWSRAYPEYKRAKTESGMQPADPGPISSTNLRLELRNRWGGTVDAGIDQLKKALDVDPSYDDALAYMNLLYRIRADMADTSEEFRQNIARADELVLKALEIKRAKGGFTAGSTAPPPSGGGVPSQIRVGGAVQAAKLIDAPKPVYPPQASQARIQGVVRFNATIGKDGSVVNLTLVSGHPLLVPPATEAVRQYRYQPTLLNGQPVEVVTQIDVPFTL